MSAATENIEHLSAKPTERLPLPVHRQAPRWGQDGGHVADSVDRDTEFSIFDLADLREILDERGWLYGVLPSDDGDLRDIGTWNEQVAEFQPGSADGEPWHGYPKWPVDQIGPPNRTQAEMPSRPRRLRPDGGCRDDKLASA